MDICTFFICEDGVATINSELQGEPMALVFAIGFGIGLTILLTRPWKNLGADMGILSYVFLGLVTAMVGGLVMTAIYVLALGITVFFLTYQTVLMILMGSVVVLVVVYIFQHERHEV